jgi:hypothetical protein
MPYKDPEPTDPNMLVGVMLPADAEATREMAYVFAEEFARLGYTREQLLWLFRNPFYGGAHGAYRSLGEQETLSIIDEGLNVWGRVQTKVQDVQTVQANQAPSFILPRVAGKERGGGSHDEGSTELRHNDRNGLNGAQQLNGLNDLNGAQRLNDWNGWNPREEESDDG